jgi:uncharacterized membrane protein YebE (DUF533 family)
MFDAKKLLEMLMKGAQPAPAPQQQGGGGLGDILGQILGGGQGGQPAARGGAQQGGDAGGSLADILGKLGGQAPSQGGQHGSAAQGGSLGDLLGKVLGQGQAGQAQAAPAQRGAPQADAADHGGLGDLLRKLQEQMGGAAGGAGAPTGGAAGGGMGGLGDILGQVFGQAKAGVSEGARRIDDATGASGHVRAATQGATGQSQEEILAQIKDWVSKNQMGAGAAAGGLGAVVLGTKAGRSLAGKAVKIGALALIGGLAYKAIQNYQSGRPLMAGSDPSLAEAPHGTGYETAAVTHDSALLYIRAMISAAAADGRIDANEQQKIFGSLKQAGMEAGAEAFVRKELQNPASIGELVAGIKTEQEAVQVYTAARVAIDGDDADNQAFLGNLAQALGMDAQLAQHIDAAARSAA